MNGQFQKGHKFIKGAEKGWFKKGDKALFKGNKHTAKAKAQMSLSHVGKHVNEKSGMWKGDKVGRVGLGLWVRHKLGNPKVCENKCKYPRRTALGKLVNWPSRFFWVNKSRTFKRDLTDWIALCPMCTAEYVGKTKNKKRRIYH